MDVVVLSILLAIAVIWAMWLHIRAKRHRSDGQIVIMEKEDGTKLFSLEIDKNPDEIAKMKYVCFKITGEATEELDDTFS